jgi:hypothetical protein
MVYLQKFSDDALMSRIIPRMSDLEISTLFDMLSRLLKAHLNEKEYHHVFLKDTTADQSCEIPSSSEVLPFPKKE